MQVFSYPSRRAGNCSGRAFFERWTGTSDGNHCLSWLVPRFPPVDTRCEPLSTHHPGNAMPLLRPAALAVLALLPAGPAFAAERCYLLIFGAQTHPALI